MIIITDLISQLYSDIQTYLYLVVFLIIISFACRNNLFENASVIHNQIAIIVMYSYLTMFFRFNIVYFSFRYTLFSIIHLYISDSNGVQFYPTVKFEILIVIERIAIKKILARLDILLIENEI